MQGKAQRSGAISRASRLTALVLVFQSQPEAHLVNADSLALLTSILETTSGQQWPGQWRTLGPEVWPRIRAMIRTRRTASKGSQVGEENKKKGKDSLVNDRKGEASTQKAQSGPKESEARKKRRGIASVTEDRR